LACTETTALGGKRAYRTKTDVDLRVVRERLASEARTPRVKNV
jgi:hypothetical protein